MTGDDWRKLEPFVQAAITRRLHLFYDALIERGQISPASSEGADLAVLHAECSIEADSGELTAIIHGSEVGPV